MNSGKRVLLSTGVIAALLVGSCLVSTAQVLQRSFAASTVILHTGDTLRGPLTYFPKQDVIILTMPDLTQRTFSPGALRAIVVRGEISNTMFKLVTASRPAVSQAAAQLGVVAIDPANPFLPRVLQRSRNKVFITHQWTTEHTQRYRARAGLFEVIVPGKIMLLQRQDEAMPAQKSRVYYTRPTTEFLRNNTINQISDAFTQTAIDEINTSLKSRLYISMPDGELHFLRNPRKQLPMYFPDYSLRKFAQEQGILWSSPSGVARVVEYVNTLTSPYGQVSSSTNR